MNGLNYLAEILQKSQSNLPNKQSIQSSTLSHILNIVFLIIGAFAILMIVLAGLKYITSQGDSAKVTEAKNQILYAVIGLIVAASAALVVNFVLGNF